MTFCDGYAQVTPLIEAHKGPIFVMTTKSNSILYTGGSDGMVKAWLMREGILTPMTEEPVCNVNISKFKPGITSIDIRSDDTVLIATLGNQIYQVSKQGQYKKVLEGHNIGAVWAVACNPQRAQFVSCGSDQTIRLWDAKKHEMMSVSQLG